MKRKILFLILSLVMVISSIGLFVFADTESTDEKIPYHNETVLESGDVETVYGTIPAEYADADAYPIIVFFKGTFKSAETKFATGSGGAFQIAKNLMDNDSERNNCVEIYLRNDVAVTARLTNTGQMSGTLTVDLNGYTLSSSSVMIYNAEGKKYSEIYPLKIITQNGNVSLNGAPLLKCSAYGTAYADLTAKEKEMTFDFKNIDFSYVAGATAEAFLAKYLEDETVTTGKKTPTPVNFSDCRFDFTNAPLGMPLFNACDPDVTQSNNVPKVTVEGCEFIMNDANSFEWYNVSEANDSFVKFVKDSSGNYPTLTLPSSAPEPTTKIMFADSAADTAEEAALAKVSDDGDTKTYKIGAPIPADFGFGIKSSLTLDTSVVYNVYLAKEGLQSFVINGEVYEDLSALDIELISEKEYYALSIELPSAEMLKDISIKVNLSSGSKTAEFTYTLSVPKYVNRILSDDGAGANLKILAKDIIAYAAAAYDYFPSANVDEMQKAEEIIDPDYDEIRKLTVEGEVFDEYSGFEDVTLVLGAKPAVRFYLPSEANYEDYAFFVNGNKIKTKYTLGGNYIETDVYAYALCETIEYTVGGSEEISGSYHINSYYTYAKTLGDEKLVTLVERFWKYLQSARAFRFEALGDASAEHTHDYYDREVQMSLYTANYSEKICACGESHKTLHTGLESGDEKVSVYFLGNSYTSYNDMSSMFKSIADSVGIEVDVVRTIKGGWHLWQFAKENDTGGQMFYSDIEEYDFDYAFIQDGSTQTLAAIGEFYDGVRLVGEVLENDGTEVLLYQTWGRKEGHSVLEQYELTTETMAYTVAAAYEAIAEETGYTLSPAGSAFLDVYTNHPEIELYDPDLTHPSATGSYLVALCHYATLFGRSPIGVPYTAGLDADTALILQTAAYNAVYGESIVPEEYKTSSEGVHVVVAENNLTEIPEGAELISVGITGDNGSKASSVIVDKDSTLTEEQRLDMSNTAYGVSIIGNKNMVTSLARATDKYWGTSRLSFDFDGNYYDITGDVDPNEPYKALITYNFGGIVNISAIGYMSGNMDGFAQAQDVYVSNDGISWSIVPSASYDALLLGAEGGLLQSVETLPLDANSTAPGVCVVFDMNSESGGVWAKYVRFAIKEGIVLSNKKYDINTLELAVFGKSYNSCIEDIEDGSVLISKGMTASEEHSEKGSVANSDEYYVELTDAQKADIADMEKYGISLIGARALIRSIKYACDGVWTGSNRLSAYFYDDNGNDDDEIILYDINGNASENGKYECLMTYNFGETVTLDAVGYMSGSMDGFAQTQEVWISKDGVNWIRVNTACYDRAGGDTLTDVTNKPKDKDGAGKTSGSCVLFDMGGLRAQYVRVAIVDGMSNDYAKDLNTYELAVYGKKD